MAKTKINYGLYIMAIAICLVLSIICYSPLVLAGDTTGSIIFGSTWLFLTLAITGHLIYRKKHNQS